MNEASYHAWAGERLGTNWVVRRLLPDGWYLLRTLGIVDGATQPAFDWGANSMGARHLACALLVDAYGLDELALAAADDFAAQVVANWKAHRWELSAVQLQAWVTSWLNARISAQAADGREIIRRFLPGERGGR